VMMRLSPLQFGSSVHAQWLHPFHVQFVAHFILWSAWLLFLCTTWLVVQCMCTGVIYSDYFFVYSCMLLLYHYVVSYKKIWILRFGWYWVYNDI
jgi:hypothetical protein